MLTQYQEGGRGLFRWWGKSESLEKTPQACTEQANRVDITKHKCRDIGLPDGMGVPNRQVAHNYVYSYLPTSTINNRYS